MKIVVREEMECGEDIRFAVDLPPEFDCYKPEFLRQYFTEFMMSAFADLRSPDYMHIAIHLNDECFRTKIGIYTKTKSMPDKKLLSKIMSKPKAGFISPPAQKEKKP